MAVTAITYGASTAITFSLFSLPTSSNTLAGRQATAIANTTNKYIDAYVGGKITTGTTPVTAGTVEVWVFGAVNDTPTYPDVITGTDGTATFADAGAKFTAMRRAAFINTDNTSDQTYWIAPFSVASLFGGILPTHWGLFLAHSTGVSLNATTANHSFSYTGIKYDTA